MAAASDTPFDHLWDYNDPAGTEKNFRAINAASLSRSHRLQLLTQIARTLGLQRKFDEAHLQLDQVRSQLDDPTVHIRYFLERGRVFNSSGKKLDAMPLFIDTANLAIEHKLDSYAVDAMHMIAIAEPDPAKQLEWNFKAMKLAESSEDQRARNWLGSLYNNIGWTYFEQKRFDDALKMFEKGLALREQSGKTDLIQVAHYCIAKTLRAMNRIDEALAELSQLNQDGYICEELGECHLARGEHDLARSHFKKAFELLAKDEWLNANEPARLERIQELGEAR